MLIATARDSIQQRVEGLDAGADDYVLEHTTSTGCWPASARSCAALRVGLSLSTNTRAFVSTQRPAKWRRADNRLFCQHANGLFWSRCSHGQAGCCREPNSKKTLRLEGRNKQ